MGPERKAPENPESSILRIQRCPCFNGAGAKGSGKLLFFQITKQS